MANAEFPVIRRIKHDELEGVKGISQELHEGRLHALVVEG